MESLSSTKDSPVHQPKDKYPIPGYSTPTSDRSANAAKEISFNVSVELIYK